MKNKSSFEKNLRTAAFRFSDSSSPFFRQELKNYELIFRAEKMIGITIIKDRKDSFVEAFCG